MITYAVCEVAGKQYKIIPGQVFDVTLAGEPKEIEASVLLLSIGDKLEIGNPYLKEKITLKSLGSIKGDKIRVSKFHAKANYRRNTGFRSRLTKVVLKP